MLAAFACSERGGGGCGSGGGSGGGVSGDGGSDGGNGGGAVSGADGAGTFLMFDNTLLPI